MPFHYLRSTPADPYRPYRLMLALNVPVLAAVFIYVINRYPDQSYLHLLVTYRFGLIKRALVGELMSYGFEKVSILHVYVLGLVTWTATLITFLYTFNRCFRIRRETLPLLVMFVSSPFFLKNFMYTLGHSDIYGCLIAMAAILLPLSLVFPLVLGGACVVLLLIHHLHMLLYIPVIIAIAVLRYRQQRAASLSVVMAGIAMLCLNAALFLYLSFFGSAPVPREVFAQSLFERALDPMPPKDFIGIWYSSIGGEITETWKRMPQHALRFPAYLGIALLHWPLFRFGAALVDNLADATDRLLVRLSLFIVTAGYLIISAVVFDYARWVSNWAVCLILVIHAARLLPARPGIKDALPPPGERSTLIFAWLLTFYPAVGRRVHPF